MAANIIKNFLIILKTGGPALTRWPTRIDTFALGRASAINGNQQIIKQLQRLRMELGLSTKFITIAVWKIVSKSNIKNLVDPN